MENNIKKPMDLDTLAVKMDEQFAKVDEKFVKMDEQFAKVDENHEFLAQMVAHGFEKIGTRLDTMDIKFDAIEHNIKALNSNVNNYLELSEKRYAELKQRDAILAKWLKLVADKTGVPIDISQLEKI